MVQSYGIGEVAAEEPFGTLVRMAANLLHAPIAMLSLMGAQHLWIVAAFGTDCQQLPRSLAICDGLIDDPIRSMVIPDMLRDPRFMNHPLVLSSPHIRFYAGVCLIDGNGYVLGTLDVMDTKPSGVGGETLALLHEIAGEAVGALARQRAKRGIALEEHTIRSGEWPGTPPHDRIPRPISSLERSSQRWLGVRTEHTSLPGSNRQGRLIIGVAANSPAERANLQINDVILALDSRAARRRTDITGALAGCVLGRAMRLQVWRNGKIFECDIRPETMPETRVLQHWRPNC